MTEYKDINLQDLTTSENNVRSTTVEDLAGADFQELLSSVKERGILEPLIVVKGAVGDEYNVVGGRRRLLALQQIWGKKSVEVPCVVMDLKDEAVDEWTISALENKHRRNLTPQEWKDTIEKGKKMGLNQTEISKRLGVSKAAVSMMASGKTWTEQKKASTTAHAEPKAQEPTRFGKIECPSCGVLLEPIVDGNTLRLDIPVQDNTDKPSRSRKK